MNGTEVNIQRMRCKTCDATAKYNIHCSVSFVDANRTMNERCVCEE